MPTFLLTLFIVICLLLIVVVLLQKGRGGGIGGDFGGGMTSSAFGTRTGDVFTWVTVVLTSLFLLLAIVTTVLIRPPEVQVHVIFDPAPTTAGITEETPVQIKTDLSAKQDKTIRYTLDGSNPTEKSPEYLQDPVKVKPGQTLTATVWRNGKAGKPATAFYGRPDQYAKPTPTSGAVESQPTSGSAGLPVLAPEANAPAKPASAPAGGVSTPPTGGARATPEATSAPARPAMPAAAASRPASNPAP